jgi:cytochrome bd-type quinol oxidase subunit 2
VYAICYTVLAAALMFAVYGNALARKDLKARATQLDRKARWAFPVGLLLALVFANRSVRCTSRTVNDPWVGLAPTGLEMWQAIRGSGSRANGRPSR